jgi:hypothetical protein
MDYYVAKYAFKVQLITSWQLINLMQSNPHDEKTFVHRLRSSSLYIHKRILYICMCDNIMRYICMCDNMRHIESM